MELTKLPIFYDYFFSEFNSDSCFKVLYMKNNKFATKQVYVQDIYKKKEEKKIKNTPAQKPYTGMPVMPVTHSMFV